MYETDFDFVLTHLQMEYVSMRMKMMMKNMDTNDGYPCKQRPEDFSFSFCLQLLQ